jgi:hypothetical protein
VSKHAQVVASKSAKVEAESQEIDRWAEADARKMSSDLANLHAEIEESYRLFDLFVQRLGYR